MNFTFIKLCSLAWYVLCISVIGGIIQFIKNPSIFKTISYFISTIFFVWLTNWACRKYRWLSWFILIMHILALLALILFGSKVLKLLKMGSMFKKRK